MDRRLQEAVFTELKNRYDGFIVSVIRNYFKGEDVKDIFQELQVHLFNRIGELYDEHPDLFSTKAWLRSVVSKYCISEIRKRNGKRKIKLVYDEISLNVAKENEIVISENQNDLDHSIQEFLKNLDKRDALILKMKYYYGKPSNYISKKMNETHVNVYIGRLKERLIKKTGISDLESFVKTYNTSL
jgi:RNA polymerase sigma factor (sigma-70 family)